MKEIWKDIGGYSGDYQISNLGRVKSFKKKNHGKILKLGKDGCGYYRIGLMKHGKRVTEKVHRLVACAFIPNPENKPEVNHKDSNKTNNAIKNLEWSTHHENAIHCFSIGSGKSRDTKGYKNVNAKLNENDVRLIRKFHRHKLMRRRAIAQKFKVSLGAVDKVIYRDSWNHV